VATTGASVDTGTSVAAGASVTDGAAVVAGPPQAERSSEVRTSRLTKDQSTDFLFISLSPFISLEMDVIGGRIFGNLE
jgi:hypothetical protein